MSKNITISLTNGTPKRGEKNRVDISIDFPKLTNVRGIHAEFKGFEKTTASYTTVKTVNGKTKTVTETATEYVEITKQEFLLMGDERKGFFGRIGDSMKTVVGGGEHEDVDPGELTFEIDVLFPKDAPASFKGKKCEVVYSVSVAVDIPVKIDWHETLSLTLPPVPIEFNETKPVHVVFPDDTGRSLWNKTFGKDVLINLAVDRDTLTIGEEAMAMLTMETPEPIKVNKIDVNVVGVESSQAQGHRDRFEHRHSVCQIESPGIISNDSVNEFEIIIPELEGLFSQRGTNFDITWAIEVRLYIPWASDPVISAPITILPSV